MLHKRPQATGLFYTLDWFDKDSVYLHLSQIGQEEYFSDWKHIVIVDAIIDNIDEISWSRQK